MDIEKDRHSAFNVEASLQYFYEQKMHFDVEFRTPCGTSLYAHKVVLAIKSATLAEIIYCNENNIIFTEPDNSDFGIKQMIRYSYYDEVIYHSVSDVLEIFKVAKTFDIEPMANQCIKYLNQLTLTSENVLEILEAAITLHQTECVEKCTDFLRENTDAVIQSTYFPKAKRDTILTILQLQTVTLSSEILLLHAVASWLLQQSNEERDIFLSNINIMDFDVDEFIDFISHYPEFFTDSEVGTILANLKRKGIRDLPAFCKAQNKKRTLKIPDNRETNSENVIEESKVEITLIDNFKNENDQSSSETRIEEDDICKDICLLLEKHLLVDVQINLKLGNKQRVFYAHKLVLAMRSSLLADALFEKYGHITLHGISDLALEQMIRYSYYDDVTYHSVSDVLEIFKVAKIFDVEPMANQCIKYLNQLTLNNENVLEILEVATTLHQTECVEKCIDFLQENTDAIIQSAYFPKARRDTILTILQLQTVTLSSEIMLLHAIALWLRHQSSEERDIFLSTMNIMDFVVDEFMDFISHYPGFFTDSEVVSILANLKGNGIRELPAFCKVQPKKRTLKYPNIKEVNSENVIDENAIEITVTSNSRNGKYQKNTEENDLENNFSDDDTPTALGKDLIPEDFRAGVFVLLHGNLELKNIKGVEFVVIDETEKKNIYSRFAPLKEKSIFFKELLSVPTLINPVAYFEDLSCTGISHMLSFINDYAFHLLRFKDVTETWKASKRFEIKQLQDYCEMKCVEQDISPSNVTEIWEAAKVMNLYGVQNSCNSVMRSQTEEILNLDSLLNISALTMFHLLEQTELSLQSEAVLLKSVILWLQKQENNKYRNEALNKIAIVSLTEEEFKDIIKEFPDFFNTSEILTLKEFKKSSSNNTLPLWCNGSLTSQSVCRNFTIPSSLKGLSTCEFKVPQMENHLFYGKYKCKYNLELHQWENKVSYFIAVKLSFGTATQEKFTVRLYASLSESKWDEKKKCNFSLINKCSSYYLILSNPIAFKMSERLCLYIEFQTHSNAQKTFGRGLCNRICNISNNYCLSANQTDFVFVKNANEVEEPVISTLYFSPQFCVARFLHRLK
ncbi:uncharacterized protein LOC118186626 isoform X2 [Stegodyphus dumicola]|uniref:uncharacterized protein LOC118186626 isoform X2 n=1 Tax=Stegodyphus dumicola TaxID=202533 RepID=UPI0015A7DFF1|nr:uncharacterized protein LOC118186626 isoform X2 [Stegodyphus dumicola]